MAENTMNPVPVIGIDLGTSFSCVVYLENDMVRIVPNGEGSRLTPSTVAFTQRGNLVGDMATLNPSIAVFDAKRLLGKKYSDDSIQIDMKLWPFKVNPGTNDRPILSVTCEGEKREFAPEQISSFVFIKLKQIAETYIGSEVKNVVVTVPANFNQLQLLATRDAIEMAGINVLALIDDPTADAIAFSFDQWFHCKKDVLDFDLGDGTFDVSVFAIKNGNIEVKAIGGYGHLGGEDFVDIIVNYCISIFNRKHSRALKTKHYRDISKNPKVIRRLRSACEDAKRMLTCATEVYIDLEYLLQGLHFCHCLTRSKFAQLNLDLFHKCIEAVGRCLSDSKLNKDAIDHVLLIGGSGRITNIQELLTELFDSKDLCTNICSLVASGEAIQAAYLSGHGNQKIRRLALTNTTSSYTFLGLESRSLTGLLKDAIRKKNI